jgi:DNA polymerase III delta prime subunit
MARILRLPADDPILSKKGTKANEALKAPFKLLVGSVFERLKELKCKVTYPTEEDEEEDRAFMMDYSPDSTQHLWQSCFVLDSRLPVSLYAKWGISLKNQQTDQENVHQKLLFGFDYPEWVTNSQFKSRMASCLKHQSNPLSRREWKDEFDLRGDQIPWIKDEKRQLGYGFKVLSPEDVEGTTLDGLAEHIAEVLVSWVLDAERRKEDKEGFDALYECIPDGDDDEVPLERHQDESQQVNEEPMSRPSLEEQLVAKLCVVLQGPPGTGKTYTALELVMSLSGDKSSNDTQWSHLLSSSHGSVEEAIEAGRELPFVWDLVQMHPGYTYEDFVCGLSTQEGVGIHFKAVDRIVLELAKVALANEHRPVLLIMDEINRCNLASVLGELIFALEKDKRGKMVRLQHGPSVVLPENLWFLGTMNTADRSIALVDYAIRRRFRFVDVNVDPGVLTREYAGHDNQSKKASKAMIAINKCIVPDTHRVGHAYFMEKPDDPDWPRLMADRLIYEVLPLVREYLREDSGIIKPGVPVEMGEVIIDLTTENLSNLERLRDRLEAYFQ